MTDNESNKKIDINFKLFAVLGGVLLVALTAGLVVSFKTSAFINVKVAEDEEAKRPAELRLTILDDTDCADCFRLDGLIAGLKQFNVKIVDEKTVDWKSDEGKLLIEKYQIDKIPALIVSGEINKEVQLKNSWPQIGEIIDSNFVLRQVRAPYIEVASGEERGLVEISLLKDDSCQECYDVMVHQQILGNGFGLPVANVKVLSAGSGEGLVLKNKYEIILAPTFIISGDLAVYPSLLSIWEQVGTVEADGAYVFRQGVEQMGVYKNLTSGQVVEPVADIAPAP